MRHNRRQSFVDTKQYANRAWYCILFIVVLSACVEQPEQKMGMTDEEEQINQEPVVTRTHIPEEFLKLRSAEKYVPSEDMLFGRFFNDRAEFFIIDQPLNKVFNSDVESVTLCYLDDLLSKTTFLVKENIASELMANYGSFRISGHDLKNRELIKSGNIWIEKGKILSDELDNFRMAWTLGEQEIWFRVDKSSSDPYVYIEMTDQYSRMLRVIEQTY